MSSSTQNVPLVKLRDGLEIPQLGFGVFQVPPEDTAHTVARALEIGYRHIDTASAYRNEAGVGDGLRSSGLERGDVFVTTKCWNDHHGKDAARGALERSLERLGMDYVDLYLIHWPVPAADRYVETWQAFIQAHEEGLARSIGVSNFQPAHLERLVAGDRGHAQHQPGRAAPALPAADAAAHARAARRGHRGLEPARAGRGARRARDRRDRRGP